MQITYYPCARRMRAGRKSLIREVRQMREPEKGLDFTVPEGSNLSGVVAELAKHAKPFAVHIWINRTRIEPPSDETRMRTIDEGDTVVLIQDLSGDALRGLSWIVCAEGDEEEAA